MTFSLLTTDDDLDDAVAAPSPSPSLTQPVLELFTEALDENMVTYQDADHLMIEADCSTIMKLMPDRSVDLVITDPPYSERTHAGARTTDGPNKGGTELVHFSSIEFPELRAAFAEMGRVTRRWVVATVDYHHAFALENEPPDGLRLLRVGVWVKPVSMPQISGDRPGMGWESIVFLHRSDLRPAWNGGGRNSVWNTKTDRSGHHPTAKPLPMLQEWVRLFSEPGDIVFDPFAGSASTGVAAKAEGRRSVCVEIDPQWHRRGGNRLAQEVLF